MQVPIQAGGHSAERLLEGLSPSQREAVISEAQPLCILAAAGSGKTTILARRIAWRAATQTAAANHILALTFTRKAAGELRSRVAKLGIRDRVDTSTFHSAAFSSLRLYWDDRGTRRPAIARDPTRLLASHRSSGTDRGLLAAVAAEIAWAKARLVGPRDYEAAARAAVRTPPISPAAVAQRYAEYEKEKRRRHVVDVGDLVILVAAAIEQDPSFAAAQRWMHRHFFVDEAQDMNPAQWRLLRAWLGEGSDLCLVGDPLQAIYGWNGSDPEALESFASSLPAGHVIEATDNWRSAPEVIRAAASLAPPGSRTVPVARRSFSGTVQLESHQSEQHEAAWLALRLRRLHAEGHPWREMAVLARTNAQLGIVARALSAGEVPWRRERAREGIGRAGGQAVWALASQETQGGQGWVGDLLADAAGRGASPVELANLEYLAGEYRDLSPNEGPAGLLAWIGEDSASGQEAVSLLSFHRSKGLEWNCVFLIGLQDNMVPFGGNRAADPEEERRLLYVAMTRARMQMIWSWIASPEGAKKAARRRKLSRLIDPSLASVEQAPTPPLEAMAHLERVRLQLNAASAKQDPAGDPRDGRDNLNHDA